MPQFTTTPKRSQPAANESPAYCIDAEEIRKAWSLFIAPDQVTELRCLNTRLAGEYRSGTYSGYFTGDNVDAVIAAIQRIESATACYFMPNPVDPALLGRAFNRARIVKDNEPTTSDHNIVSRRWLLIDVDAKRPAGLSATDSEKSAALELATDIDNHLWERGFPPGVMGDSGNGAHVMIPLDSPANDNGAHERFLKDMAKRFNNDRAEVDISVFNPARIWKLPGTLVCKGDHAPAIGRVWRMARIVAVCNEVAQ